MAKPEPKQTMIAPCVLFVIMMPMVASLCIDYTQKLMGRFVVSLVHEKGTSICKYELVSFVGRLMILGCILSPLFTLYIK